jgi:uncharacterized membrane protein YkvA (DUF1232 family)
MDRKNVWNKMKQRAKTAGWEVLEAALTLWYCLIDQDTPVRIKALIFGDLVYFVSPVDAIPDAIPVIGYSDDLAVMLGTLAFIASHVKPQHRKKAKTTCAEWLGNRATA